MARKEKRAAPLGTEEKPYSKFQWFLFAIIPVVFTVLMALVIMSVLDVNVFQWAKDKGKDIPLISGLIDNNEMTETEVAYEKRIVDLEAEIKDSEQWQQQFRGKKIFKAGTQEIGLSVVKKVTDAATQCDGITGATLTMDGVTAMFADCLKEYKVFLTNEMQEEYNYE